jgi:hypothetical protein
MSQYKEYTVKVPLKSFIYRENSASLETKFSTIKQKFKSPGWKSSHRSYWGFKCYHNERLTITLPNILQMRDK